MRVNEVPSYRLACLFHDIGKLKSRVDTGSLLIEPDDEDANHDEFSGEFLRELFGDEDAAILTETHHGRIDAVPDRLERDAAVLQAANTLATARNLGKKRDPYLRLENVFSVLDEEPRGVTYPLEPLALDEEVIFPQKGGSDDLEYATQTADLKAALADADTYEHVVHVLEKYTWSVPAYRNPYDVPLYDHLRVTAALGDAIERSEVSTATLTELAKGNEVGDDLFTLVKGDISGIQDFLHRMRSPDDAQENAAKRMRGRSTELWLLTVGIWTLFLRQLNLPVTSLVSGSSGQFYALVPPEMDDEITSFEEEVNQWLFEEYSADLSVVFGTQTATANDEFGDLFQQAASQADTKKLQKGSPIVDTLLERENPAILGPPREPCPVCGGENEPTTQASDELESCRICSRQEQIGRDLPTATHLSLEFGGAENDHLTIELDEATLSLTLTSGPASADRVYTLNEVKIPNGEGGRGWKFTGARVAYGGAVQGERVWSFNEHRQLTRNSLNRIHVAKMDVDDLAEAISTGMEGGPSRLAAISRSLELFMAGYVNNLVDERAYYMATADACEACRDILKQAPRRCSIEHRDSDDPGIYARPDVDARSQLHRKKGCVTSISPIYIGFSGGDDMFFVGSWDEAIEFGRQVHDKFDTYTDGILSISGGFFFTRPNFPIGRGIEHAEEHLKYDAKDKFEFEGKDAAYLFGESLPWATDTQEDTPSCSAERKLGMKDLLACGKQLETFLNEGQMSSSTLYTLLELQEELDLDGENKDNMGVREEWKIKYQVRDLDQEVREELEEPLKQAMYHITVPVSWAALATR